MTSGNLRKLHIIYWRHSSIDWENARTTELFNELTYNDKLALRFRNDLHYVFANCNRKTESYVRYKDVVELHRQHKIRMEPTVYLEFWQAVDGRKEEYWSIDSDYRLKKVIERLDYFLNKWQ